MNDSRIHRNIKIARDDSAVTLGCSDWCGLPLNASERISERALIFSLDVVPEACFTAMTEDHHDELAAMDLSVIAVALTPAWLVWILTVMPVWLYFSSFLFCSVLFLITKLYLLYECKMSLIFITVHKLANYSTSYAWKPLKLDCSFHFLLEDFRLCSRYNNVNYGAWPFYKPLFGSSVAICQRACSEI